MRGGILIILSFFIFLDGCKIRPRPEPLESLLIKGNAALKKAQYQEAERYFRKAIELYPTSAAARYGHAKAIAGGSRESFFKLFKCFFEHLSASDPQASENFTQAIIKLLKTLTQEGISKDLKERLEIIKKDLTPIIEGRTEGEFTHRSLEIHLNLLLVNLSLGSVRTLDTNNNGGFFDEGPNGDAIIIDPETRESKLILNEEIIVSERNKLGLEVIFMEDHTLREDMRVREAKQSLRNRLWTCEDIDFILDKLDQGLKYFKDALGENGNLEIIIDVVKEKTGLGGGGIEKLKEWLRKYQNYYQGYTQVMDKLKDYQEFVKELMERIKEVPDEERLGDYVTEDELEKEKQHGKELWEIMNEYVKIKLGKIIT
jgi:tetratricopeptide (TPR) repeat protein